jgi:UDP-N-acetylmuramate dehydrogenase
MELLKNFSLKRFNTFGVDVAAKTFVEIKNENDLVEILSSDENSNESIFILGGGSNILFTKDFEGLVLKNSIPGIRIIKDDDNRVIIESGAGVIWNDLVTFCVNKNYGGVENLSLIPGTVGAAPIQNIGAYGEELSETFLSLDGIYTETGERGHFSREDCQFGYRNSIFKNELKNKFVVTRIKFSMNQNPKIKIGYGNVKEELERTGKTKFTIKDVSEAISKIRREKLPDPNVIGNAGSFFKNPEINSDEFESLKQNHPDLKGYPVENSKIKVPAAWMIEKTGWKGYRNGNVGTHKIHALVIVNYGEATGEEILHFAKDIKRTVYEEFGIVLEEEVNIV